MLRLRLRNLPIVVGTVLVVIMAAACGSGSGSGSGSTSTSSPPSGGSTGGGSSNSGGSGGANASGSGSQQLDSFESSMQAGANATYKATYTETSSGSSQSGSTTTVTVEQRPPRSLFSSVDSSDPSSTSTLIDDGKTLYSCSGAPGQVSCFTSPSGSSGQQGGSLAGIMNFLNPTAILSTLKQDATSLKLLGITIKGSQRTVAGQDTNCISIGPPGEPASTYCSTKDGVLAYSDSGSGDIFEMTSYSSSVSDADFAPPAGAQITSASDLGGGGSTTSSP